MIRVSIDRDRAGRVVRLDVSGHDPAAPAGENLVCAAVSAMTEMALVAILEVAGLPAGATIAKGRVTLELPPETAGNEAARVAVESLIVGFRRINERYGERITLKE